MTLSELNENPPRVLALETVSRFDRCCKQATFLGHGAFLSDQEVTFVGIEEKNTANWQEDEQYVERKEPKRDARGEPKLHRPSFTMDPRCIDNRVRTRSLRLRRTDRRQQISCVSA